MTILLLIISYLLGSVPFGLLLTKLAGMSDLRKIGSGNIGATNVLRSGNKKLALLTLLFDALKGALVVFLASNYLSSDIFIYLASLIVILGHIFPIWLKFKGGKGVATLLGVLVALNIYVAILFAVIWLITFALSRISSLSSILATFALPVFSLLNFTNWDLTIFYLLISFIVVLKHYDNIIRLLNREEKPLKI